MKINILNVNKIPLTYHYDVVMMYRNYIKNDIKKYKICKKQNQILQS
ncbi:hypothetical protein HNP37_003066 [Flavobacterium nitrogenifigens]|uniref:Uncharacterized protein n=2 Tax=Flavobacterium TaxID=237 RepID=A0A7W7IYK7_9FLAO|nr:hypothetical protein [Flavobacterium nitrogenifigens]MBB6387949.1 hypothetical protein [Flavobacterium notoginsengisoli]